MSRLATGILTVIFIFLASSCKDNSRYQSSWDKSPDGVWCGPELWANRLQDWKVENGKLFCINTRPMRTVHLTTISATPGEGTISTSVKIYPDDSGYGSYESAAGILLGSGRGLDFRAASLIHHSYGKLAGLFIGLDGEGNLFLRDFEEENSYLLYERKIGIRWKEALLIILVKPDGEKYLIRATAVDPVSNQVIDKFEVSGIDPIRIEGGLALVSHAGYTGNPSQTFSFSNWKVSGSKIACYPDRLTGPLTGLQYTLSRNTLKMTVQFPPVGSMENHTVNLQMLENNQWVNKQSSKITEPSFTARFRVENWNTSDDIPFRILYEIDRGSSIEYSLEGIIKHNPLEKDSITLLSLSCVEQVIKANPKSWSGIDAGSYPWDYGILYPHNQLIDNLMQFDPDLLYFAGDQVYEGASPTAADPGNLELDYLYKWYLWCLSYKPLTTRTPSITIPDDHDVYHGNIWGAGGIATPQGLTGAAAQDAGGYKYPADFVNMVQETQTSHLPDPYDPEPVEQGIGVYFTEYNVGGVSFAILEDRKFKSAPRNLLPDARIFNGWPMNPEWSARRSSAVEATLLGNRQLAFLEKWASDWSGATWMKAALSQTLMANLATLPSSAMNDGVVPGLEIPDSAVYVEGDKMVSDFDSNGWPQAGRNRAIRIFRRAFATHIAGDQHLGSTVQYGVDEFRDANFAIISPATGNIFPRRWFPPVEGRNRPEGWPPNYGDFEDGFGNRMTVHAVANPHLTKVNPTQHHQLATGYSSIIFYRNSREIELTNWPYYAGPENGNPFPGWPVRINQLDNYGRRAEAWLPELEVSGIQNPVVRILRERTGELEYSLRINGTTFQPWVFFYGSYTIEVGDPDTGQMQIFEGVIASSSRERQAIYISF